MTTITIDRAIVEQALEALQAVLPQNMGPLIHPAKQALKTALAQQAEPVAQTCTWQQDGDSDSGVYGTSCGRYFNIEDGTPEDNKMAWCCYCGKKLAQELIAENSDVMAYNAARPGGSDSSDGLGPL